MKRPSYFIFLLIIIFSASTSCEKRTSFENSVFNAEIVGFVADKCGCCWGWQIKIGNQYIKTDLLPDTDLIGYIINTPIPVTIETGNKKTECTDLPDYYEIKSLVLRK